MKSRTKVFFALFLWLSLFLVTKTVLPSWGFETDEDYDDVFNDLADYDPEAVGGVLDMDPGLELQSSPDVAWNQSCNQFLVVYDKKHSDVNYNIWGRYVSGSGLALGAGPFQLTADAMKQSHPAVAYNQVGGNYLVVWEDNRHGNWEIYAQLWNCQKTKVNNPVRVTNNASHSLNPDVVCGYLPSGPVCWVVWEDFRDGNWNIYGQRLNGVGALVGGNIQLTNNTGIQRFPAIARNPEGTGCNPDGTFFVVWHDSRNAAKGFAYDIYGQQLDNVGPCGANVAVYTGVGAQVYPDIAYGTANDRYQAVWEDNRSGNWDIYGRMALPSGMGASPSFAVAAGASSQNRPAVAYDLNTNNQFLTAWQELTAGNWDVKSRRTTGLGALLGGWALADTIDQEVLPAVAFGATSDHYFTVWQNITNGIRGRAVWP